MLTESQKHDKAFIRQLVTGGWPHWPYLPMKRRVGNELEAGTLVDTVPLGEKLSETHESVRKVYLTSIWQAARENKNVRKYPSKVYDSIESMLLDGWEVD